MKLLVCGDSFAADWNGEYPGWVDILSKHFTVTNRAQAGVGEYKILKQIEQGIDYDFIIVSHTSPYRLHTNNSIHATNLHKNCDLLYNDVADKCSLFNKKVKSAKLWFETHYDEQYQEDIYRLIRQKIDSILKDSEYLSISHLPCVKKFAQEKQYLDCSVFWENNRGIVNHYSKEGNEKLASIMQNYIE